MRAEGERLAFEFVTVKLKPLATKADADALRTIRAVAAENFILEKARLRAVPMNREGAMSGINASKDVVPLTTSTTVVRSNYREHVIVSVPSSVRRKNKEECEVSFVVTCFENSF